MIILFLLCIVTAHMQAGQYSLTAPITRSYMSMSKQELQQEKEIKQQELLDENTRWHQEKVCGNVSRDIIGMSAICGIISTGIVTGIVFNIHPSIIAPCTFGAAATCENCYQPDQSAKKAELEEINKLLKLKTD